MGFFLDFVARGKVGSGNNWKKGRVIRYFVFYSTDDSGSFAPFIVNNTILTPSTISDVTTTPPYLTGTTHDSLPKHRQLQGILLATIRDINRINMCVIARGGH